MRRSRRQPTAQGSWGHVRTGAGTASRARTTTAAQQDAKHRPDWLHARLRGLGMLAILGTLSIVFTTAAGYVGSASHAAPAVIAGVLVAFALNLALFMTAFKLLTAVDVSWRDLLPGVIVAAVFWQALQHLGGFYVDKVVRHASNTYGVFALVIGLLAWLHVGAQMTVYAAAINVVLVRHLWPRRLLDPPAEP